MIISVGCDHAGIGLKQAMLPLLRQAGHEVIDHGCFDKSEMPYFPDIAQKVCASITGGEAERGIMFCGTGVGASIACNKVPGIRASLIHDGHCAHQAVEHDHVQVMCIGEQIVGPWLAWDLIRTFLAAKGDVDNRTQLILEKLADMDGSQAPRIL